MIKNKNSPGWRRGAKESHSKFANFWKNVANSLPIVVEATSNALKKHYLCTPDLKPVLGCVDKNPGNIATRSQVDEISPLGQFKF